MKPVFLSQCLSAWSHHVGEINVCEKNCNEPKIYPDFLFCTVPLVNSPFVNGALPLRS